MGIKASGVPRSEIFLTTKLPPADHTNVAQALAGSLQKLGTGYIDLCAYSLVFPGRTDLTFSVPGLMHWPAPMKNGAADKSVGAFFNEVSSILHNIYRSTGWIRGRRWKKCTRPIPTN